MSFVYRSLGQKLQPTIPADVSAKLDVGHQAINAGQVELGQDKRNIRQLIRKIRIFNHGPTTSMYYQDPDGNVLELQIENFDSDNEVDEWMSNSDFDVNPIGVDFDPGDLKARLEAGTSVEDLKIRPRIGSRSASTIPTPYVGKFAATMTRIAKFLGKKV